MMFTSAKLWQLLVYRKLFFFYNFTTILNLFS